MQVGVEAGQPAEEVLAHAGAQVQRPDAEQPAAGVVDRRDDLAQLLGPVAEAGQDRRDSAPVRMPAARQPAPSRRCAGAGSGVPGSVARQTRSSSVPIEKLTETSALRGRRDEHVEVAQ